MLKKVSTIGSADGNIIAAIITAHIVKIAEVFGIVHRDESGIVSCATGWLMSTTSHARKAQAINVAAPIPIAHICHCEISATKPCGDLPATSGPSDLIVSPIMPSASTIYVQKVPVKRELAHFKRSA